MAYASKDSVRRNQLNARIITVSDSRSAGEKDDASGKLLEKFLGDFAIEAFSNQEHEKETNRDHISRVVVPDDVDSIREALIRASDVEKVDLIITTGGTGFAERDVTPEATKTVLTKEAPGLIIALLNRSLQATPMAALSRLAAGSRDRALIVNFPGSVKAVKECWEVLMPVLPHAIDLLRGNSEKAEMVHQDLRKSMPQHSLDRHHHHHHRHDHGHHHHSHHHEVLTSSVELGNVSSRPRESPFPMIAFEEAVKRVLDQASTFPKRQVEIPLLDSLNHVLAADVLAPDPQPPFPASVKDGYAVIASDGAGERIVMSIVSTAGAGELPALQSGFCTRISTGAPVPSGANAVVQVEDTTLLEEKSGEELKISINMAPVVGQDIRPIGCDVIKGEMVLMKGTVLTSAEIGILASVGKATVPVLEWPRIAVMSTGDELVDPLSVGGAVSELLYGKIRDCNRAELMALLLQHGVDGTHVVDGGICPDEPNAIVHKLRRVFDEVDILVTSGGVSMGERDLLKQILVKDFGFQLHFARVQMKPGKPTTFATGVWTTESGTKSIMVFGLPGNPVSAWVTAQLYVLPAIREIAGYPNSRDAVIRVKMLNEFHLDPRPEFVRGIFVPPDPNGDEMPSVVLTDSNQMSSRLLSNRRANLLLMLPAKTTDKSKINSGEKVLAMVTGRL